MRITATRAPAVAPRARWRASQAADHAGHERVGVDGRVLGERAASPRSPYPAMPLCATNAGLRSEDGDRLGERPGGRDPAVGEGALVGLGPGPVRERGAGQVRHHVGVLDDRAVDLAGVRVPVRLARRQRLAADQPDHLVALAGQVVAPRGAEEAGAAGEHELHAPNVRDPSSHG